MKAFVGATQKASRVNRLTGMAKSVQRAFGRLIKVPGWSKKRELPVVPESSFRDWWDKNRENSDGE